MKRLIIALFFCSNFLCSAEPVGPDSTSPNDNYRLAPEDLLQVRVFREEDMDSTVRISRDGTVTLPLIGIVHLGGKTANEAGATVRDLLEGDYIIHPQVTVTVLEFTRQTFTILGQVLRPGSYKIPSQGSFTLLQAVGRGGGYTRIANPASVTVKRQTNGREALLKVNAKVIAKETGGQPFLILPGDTITIGESIF